jgi:hypothetical protein
MGLRQWLFGRYVARTAEDASMGKLGEFAKALWRFLDGWKTWIWAIVMALKTAFPALPIWGYVDAAAAAVHWNALVPAVDPDAMVQWGTFTIAVGHRLIKAWRQWRAGVPIQDIHSPVF